MLEYVHFKEGLHFLASGEDEIQLRDDPQFAQADFVISQKIPTSFKEFLS